jgi:hypothetical protein
MDFFLPFEVPSSPFKISYKDKIMLMGSCFSEEIGGRLSALKFNILENPNGILYDPISIAESLISYSRNEKINDNFLFEFNSIWNSWSHHSRFSGLHKSDVEQKINHSQNEAHNFLKDAKFLMITLGTAFCYQLKKESHYVANCHKVPSAFFEKELLSVEKIITHFTNCFNQVQEFNPELKIIFTISPIKHVKDGLVENNRSKARLIDAVHSLVEDNSNSFYFPSFELVNDVLRDYRFYEADLVHPNKIAGKFVFEKFCHSFFENGTMELIGHIRSVLNAVQHRPFFIDSKAHKEFAVTQLIKIQQLENKFPFLDLSAESSHFSSFNSQ